MIDFSWSCPSYLSKALPFHECSALNDDVDCYQGGDMVSSLSNDDLPSPSVTHSFLRVAHLNCRNLLENLDDVFFDYEI